MEFGLYEVEKGRLQLSSTEDAHCYLLT